MNDLDRVLYAELARTVLFRFVISRTLRRPRWWQRIAQWPLPIRVAAVTREFASNRTLCTDMFGLPLWRFKLYRGTWYDYGPKPESEPQYGFPEN